MAGDWEMPRRSDCCRACQTVFEPGTAFNAFLYDAPTGYERHDFCLNCNAPIEPPPLGSWRTRRPLPAARKSFAFDREAVLGFFHRLRLAGTPEQQRFRFVLALLLWRKKALRFESSDARADGEYWRFAVPSSGERCDVLRPELDEEEIDRLSAQLEALLATASVETLEAPAVDAASGGPFPGESADSTGTAKAGDPAINPAIEQVLGPAIETNGEATVEAAESSNA